MEDKKAYSIAISLVILLITIIIIARLTLKFSKAFYLITGADVALIVAVFAAVLIRRNFNSRRQLLEHQLDSDGRELRIEYSFLRKVAGVPTRFKLKELEEATNNFGSLIGRGSSASVFKGVLSDGASVAVKKIEGEERADKEFKSEVAAIASVQHVNLVRLLGYCTVPPTGPRFLVYEYIVNGSLNNWIFRRKRSRGCLSWDLRCRIALDVAKALSYLHHDCRSCILHLDVKPENILLDENHRAILADFGLSKLMGKDESRVVTTIRGTRGYLAPEWLLENGISEKSDVYSYGMVLLELIAGRRNITVAEIGNSRSKFSYLPKIVSEKLAQGKIMDIVDERLIQEVSAGGVLEIQVKKLACVALSCIQERPKLRPTMAQVVEMLEGRVPVEAPSQTTMLFFNLLASDEDLDHHLGQPRPAAAMPRSRQMDTTNRYSNSSCSFAMSSVLSGR
ncbi:probable receptor-like protein kinase At5g20050 [Lycium ferocissimum]|uniref:probable receptor-like protein kinase At5g20050 n=1 Tax=Lycium ferocissimum TaxID=112874 RepID=UPI00281606AE|nr:probable receptor-like protein kinase At5g20050 [Lycium ferocissimum]